MGSYSFEHVKICGIKTVLPEKFIDIDDEITFFDNSEKKLARAKRMVGYGRRYVADDNTTVTVLAVDAASKLMREMHIEPEIIECLIFVNQKPDYPEPSDASIAHGLLRLPKDCLVLHINSGCTGYIQGLLTAHAMIECGAIKNCLLLAGDLPARISPPTNRKLAPVFSDSGSASFLSRSETKRRHIFILGNDGTGWDKIIRPIGGMRIPCAADTATLEWLDQSGNNWTQNQSIMKGEDVFKFSLNVAPDLIRRLMKEAVWGAEDVDLFAIHQANRQIVENIIKLAGIPVEKTPSDVFSKYANCSTNSVVTVLCDQRNIASLHNVVCCTFGIGLSWGGAALDVYDMHNGGFSTYTPPAGTPTRAEQLEHWKSVFTGE